MAAEKCRVCGATVPSYYLTQGLCDACKWNTWIPPCYQIKEEYKLDAVWGHANATTHPPLGAEFLDRKIPRLCVMLPMCRYKPIIRTS